MSVFPYFHYQTAIMQSKHIQFQIKKNEVLNSLCNINLVCLSTVNKITIKLINLTYQDDIAAQA